MISRYWVNFAKSGDPNADALPKWPRFSLDAPEMLYLDDPIYTGPVANLKSLSAFDATYNVARGAPFGQVNLP